MMLSLASMALAGWPLPPHRSKCAVLYIAFAPFGSRPLRDFVASYERHPPGIECDLYILCKGFSDDEAINEFLDPAKALAYTAIRVPDGGFDLGTYHYVAQRLDANDFCFFNTRSVILVGDWLRMLHKYSRDAQIGAAGATASCESLYSDHLRAVAEGLRAGRSLRSIAGRSFLNRWRHRYLFPAFPNPHLRTNAFVIRADVFRRLRFGTIRSRLDTARLENGRSSITRQLRRMGLEPVIVGRDGRRYDASRWSRSDTFWQGGQHNLLVADNQTEKYALASATERSSMTRRAWGTDPGPDGSHHRIAP